jgi:hypothetical protein
MSKVESKAVLAVLSSILHGGRFMKSRLLGAVCACVSTLFTASVSAAVISDQLEDQFDIDGQFLARTVDILSFSTTGGTATFDIYAWDLNGTSLDSMIWLFNNDGSLDPVDLIAENDDSNNTFGDGSTSTLDSYLSVSLGAGNYILAIGSCCDFGASDIIDGLQYEFPSPTPVASESALFYQLTTSNNISAVPIPAAIWLFGTGLIGLVGIARREKPHRTHP